MGAGGVGRIITFERKTLFSLPSNLQRYQIRKASEAHRADCRRDVTPLTPGRLLLAQAARGCVRPSNPSQPPLLWEVEPQSSPPFNLILTSPSISTPLSINGPSALGSNQSLEPESICYPVVPVAPELGIQTHTCTYIPIHVHTHIHTCAHTYPCMCTYIPTPVQAHSHSCANTSSHMCMHIPTHVQAHLHMCAHTYPLMCKHISTPVQIHNHICAHIYPCLCAHLSTHVHIHIHMCTCVCTPVHTHLHTCAHTYARVGSSAYILKYVPRERDGNLFNSIFIAVCTRQATYICSVCLP